MRVVDPVDSVAEECPRHQLKRMSDSLAINAALPIVFLVQSSVYLDITNMQNVQKERTALQNSNYQQDIRYVFRLNIWILSLIGIWPIAVRRIGRHASNVAIAFFNFILSFAMVPCFLHIVYDQKDIILRLKLSGLLNFCLTAMTKYCILAIRRPKILHCIEYVKNDWWQVGVIVYHITIKLI